MAKDKKSWRSGPSSASSSYGASASVEDLLMAALERGDDNLQTGRFLMTFKEGGCEEGLNSLSAQGMRIADARDFSDQAAVLSAVGDADAVALPEIGIALIGGEVAQSRGMSVSAEIASDSPVRSIDPERFVFSQGHPFESLRGFSAEISGGITSDYMRGFFRAADAIAKDLGEAAPQESDPREQVSALGATWGLNACNVNASSRSGAGIKIAVLDTGVDMGHPDFTGRLIDGQTATFVNQNVQDFHGHGTHCIGTACGPKSPAGATPRYGVAFGSTIFVGKVLANSGFSVDWSVLNGINWAIQKRCQIISLSLGVQSIAESYYTAAGQTALDNGLLIIAAAGNYAMNTGAPANSPTIMSVAALDANLRPWSSSNYGKIEIAAPGVGVYSSMPRPRRYGYYDGTSQATPHVAGCAALWAETSSSLRGSALWAKLQTTAKRLPLSIPRVGAGLVQAPS